MTRNQEMIDSIRDSKYPLMKLVSGETRYELMKALEYKNKGYTELQNDIGVDQTKSFAFHVKLLIEFNIIHKNTRTRTYNLTVKGLKCIKGAKIVNEAEMFI